MSKQQETIDRLKQGLEMVNTLLKDCRDQNISVELFFNNDNDTPKNVLYLHSENNNRFELKEAYKIEKFK